MLHTTVANSILFTRYPASILGRTTDSILIPIRMGCASVHFLAFIILIEYRETLIKYSLPTPYTDSEYTKQMNELNTSLAFTFLFGLVTVAIFLSGVLIRYETLHFIQASLHAAGAGLLMTVWNDNLHTDRVWHAMLFFNLVPAVIDLLGIGYLWKQRRLWFA